MATRAIVVTRIDANTVKFAWEGLTKATDDVGEPISHHWADYADRTAQVIGTPGTGGNLRVAGSIDGTNYAALNDPYGNPLNLTAAGVKGVTEIPLFTRPEVTAGDGSTDFDVFIIARRSRSGKAI